MRIFLNYSNGVSLPIDPIPPPRKSDRNLIVSSHRSESTHKLAELLEKRQGSEQHQVRGQLRGNL